jgi:hypothetical protein
VNREPDPAADADDDDEKWAGQGFDKPYEGDD